MKRIEMVKSPLAARVLASVLLLSLAACQPQATAVTETAPTLVPAVTASPVPATPITRQIRPDNAARLTRQLQLGDGIVSGSLKVSPDGKTLAVPTTIGVDLYNAETLTRIRTLRTGGHTSHIAFSPDGSILAADAVGNEIQLWDVTAGTLLRHLEANVAGMDYCMDLAYSPDGKTVAAGFGSQADTRVWKVDDGTLVQQLKGYWLSYAPDGKKLLTIQWDEANPGITRIMRLYDLSDGSQLKEWEGSWATFSAAGTLSVEQDGAVRLWDIEKDQVIRPFSGRNAAFSMQGDKLALFSAKRVSVYTLADGGDRAREQTLQGIYEDVSDLLFSPAGDTLAGMTTTRPAGCCGAGTVDTLVLWRTSDGTVIKTMQVGQYRPYYAFVQNGKLLAAPNTERVEFLEVADGAVAASLEGYSGRVAGIAFSPDGRSLAAASGGSPLSVKLWQIAEARPVQRLEDPGSVSDFETLDVAFSPDGKTLAVRGDFWQLSSGELMTEFQRKMVEAHPFWPESVVFLPAGNGVVLGSLEGKLTLWDFATLKIRHEFEAGYTGQVTSLDISRDGSRLAAVYGYPDYVLQIWELPNGQPSTTLRGKHFTRAIFSPDGQMLATIAVPEELENTGQDAGPVQLWRVRDGQELLQLDLRDAFSLAFAPDGGTLATGSMDGTVRLWRASDGELLQTLKEQTDLISDVAFSPDGTWLAASSLDGTVMVWGIADHRPQTTDRGP